VDKVSAGTGNCAHYRSKRQKVRNADKIKYVQVVSKRIRGKQVFYLHIVCQGIPVSKIQKGEGVSGIDPGISTVAYVSKDSCELVDLVPKEYSWRNLFPAGRLDKNTTGMMLITDDRCFCT